MWSGSKCFFIFTVVAVLVFNELYCVCAILNDRSSSTTTTVSSTLPIFHNEGQPGTGKVFRLRTKTARRRRLQLPFLSTASLPIACECMDYWNCISNNGHVYSYCGISDSEVCCFQNFNVKGSFVTRNVDTIKVKPRIKVEFPTTETVPTTLLDTFTTLSPTFESTLPDVDYFYTLEDGDGDLKQITTKVKETKQPTDETNTTPSFGLNYDGSSCGTQSVEWEFDSKAEFKEWPWHVALLEIKEDVYICGATIISNEWVVTAGHCIFPYLRRNPSKLKVRAGEYDISTNIEPEPYIEVIVEKIFVHPDFNNATLANDIALVKLRQPLNYTDNIKPVCLNKYLRSHAPSHCVVTGWGRQSEVTPFSIVLKEIIVPLWTHKDCENRLRQRFGTSYKLADTAVCAGELGHDACDGDGGGGLVCFDEQRQEFYLQGITSFGIGCGRLDTPGVYTNISSYINWIESSSYFY